MAYEMDMAEIKRLQAELDLIKTELDHLELTIRAWQARSRELVNKIAILDERILLEKLGQQSFVETTNGML